MKQCLSAPRKGRRPSAVHVPLGRGCGSGLGSALLFFSADLSFVPTGRPFAAEPSDASVSQSATKNRTVEAAMHDYYAILGVSVDADLDAIRSNT